MASRLYVSRAVIARGAKKRADWPLLVKVNPYEIRRYLVTASPKSKFFKRTLTTYPIIAIATATAPKINLACPVIAGAPAVLVDVDLDDP